MEPQKHAYNPIVAQKTNDCLINFDGFEDFVDQFCREYKLDELLRAHGHDQGKKRHKGGDILKYLLKVTATGRSFHFDIKEGYADAPFKLDTIYRFLGTDSIDWISMTTELAYLVFLSVYDPGLNKPVFFVADDTGYARDFSNYCQGFSWQRDHNKNQSYKGYRLSVLSVYWNGYSFPVSGVLVSTQEDFKMLSPNEPKSESRAEILRSQLPGSSLYDVMIHQLKAAQSVGFPARFLLFDSWYSYPSVMERVRGLGLECVSMMKAGGSVKMRDEGEELNVAQIFEKHKGKGKFPFSVEVDACVKDEKNHEILSFPLLLAFWENRHRKRDFFCLASTSAGLPAQEVLQYYGHRWSIEQLIKDAKNPNLNLTGGNQSLGLAGISAYISIVLMRYLVILSERNLSGMDDERSVQAQYYKLSDEIAAAKFADGFFEGARLGFEEIEEECGETLDMDKIKQLFSRGASRSEKFCKIIQALPESFFEKSND